MYNRISLEVFLKHPNTQNLVEFFMNQIDMYGCMCSSRNFTCSKAFQEIFPESLLRKYISNSKLKNLDVKSLFTRLLLNIYIDKEPRLIIQKPNLVRIFKIPEEKESKSLFGGLSSINLNPFGKQKSIQTEDAQLIDENQGNNKLEDENHASQD